jgi:hypothetical protein
MANISTANGTMTLKGAWPISSVTSLNTIARELWAEWTYDIQFDAFDADTVHNEQSSSFSGSGRWTFQKNLEYLGDWTADEVKNKPNAALAYSELICLMCADELTIEVSFTDEENGDQVFYSQTGILSSDGKTLLYAITSNDDHDYDWDTYMKVGDDTEAFKLLVESLCEQIGVADQNSMVVKWAMIRTTPQAADFEELNDFIQEEFKALFLSIPTEGDLEIFFSLAKTAETLVGEENIYTIVGSELVKYCIDIVAAYRQQGDEPGDSGFNEFIKNRLTESHSRPADSK